MNKVKQHTIIILLAFTNFLSFAQTDSTKFIRYTPDFKFADGIYLSFEQVQGNNPIPASRIVTSENINSHNFYDKIFNEDNLVLFDENGMKLEIEKSEVWGYCKLGAIYIQYNDDFYRIPVIGSIAHFVGQELVENYRGYDPYNRYYDPNYYNLGGHRNTITTKELRQYLLDFSSGRVLLYNRKSLKVMLMPDAELYEEYNNLRRRKQKKMLFFYVRRFNERNPLMMPVYKSNIPK
ncbi:MAG: hypothetical protein U9R19_11445 [Bacteroidota bacterium]|nr:hypothetical protein [Bacteroidota bacterium]